MDLDVSVAVDPQGGSSIARTHLATHPWSPANSHPHRDFKPQEWTSWGPAQRICQKPAFSSWEMVSVFSRGPPLILLLKTVFLWRGNPRYTTFKDGMKVAQSPFIFPKSKPVSRPACPSGEVLSSVGLEWLRPFLSHLLQSIILTATLSWAVGSRAVPEKSWRWPWIPGSHTGMWQQEAPLQVRWLGPQACMF